MRVAVITGSTSGIGLGIAKALAAQGANIVLNGFGDAEGPKAEVDSSAKSNVVVRIASNIEDIGLCKRSAVPIRRTQECRNLLPLLDRTFHDSNIGDDTTIVVVLAIEDQRPQWICRLPFRSWNPLDNRIKNRVDPDPRFAADAQAPFGIQTNDGFNFFENFVL